jgi:hypothetical protein
MTSYPASPSAPSAISRTLPYGSVKRREARKWGKGGLLLPRVQSTGKPGRGPRTIQTGFVHNRLFRLMMLIFHVLKFIAVRKTLEANMQMSNMFPPGHVLWAMRDSDLHPSHRSYLTESSSRTRGPDRLRLFEVLDVERVFSQIVFARDMLTYVLLSRGLTFFC